MLCSGCWYQRIYSNFAHWNINSTQLSELQYIPVANSLLVLCTMVTLCRPPGQSVLFVREQGEWGCQESKQSNMAMDTTITTQGAVPHLQTGWAEQDWWQQQVLNNNSTTTYQTQDDKSVQPLRKLSNSRRHVQAHIYLQHIFRQGAGAQASA